MIRVYLSATVPMVRGFHEVGEWWPAPVVARAVTPQLRELLATDDIEELEYGAFLEAAGIALSLLAVELAADAGSPARRVVVAADVPESTVTPAPEHGPAAISINTPVDLDQLAAVHVDGDQARETVREAALTLGSSTAALSADIDAVFDHELEWYDVSELAAVLQLD